MKNTIFARVRAVACALGVLLGCDAMAAGYHVANGKIYEPNGQQVQVRGISHFGFNATILQPQYLWAMGWKEQIAQIKSLGFNAVRVPFVPETLYSTAKVNELSYVDPGRNPELIGKTPLQVLDLWMAEANRVGLFVMLDFHSVSSQRQYPQWWVSNPADFNLTYNKQAYTAADWRRDLAFVAQRYAHLPKFFGIDVFNEPYGEVRWTHTNPNLSWKGSVEAAASAILAANPNLLVMVQGISGNFDGIENTNIPINWGEDLQPQAYQPLNIAQDKLVFVPHTYGPDVFNKSTFSASNFPANLPPHWDTLFGQFRNVHAVVPGEWGGHYGDGLGTGGAKDVTWQNAFVDYMISRGMSSSFYWSYTPNSGDTGGVLDNNLQVRSDKMNLLKKLWGTAPTASPTTPEPTPAPTPTTPVVQPTVSGFSPASGPVGTVVTVNGTGFSGVNKAWVGQTRGAVYRVISDKQVQVTIPSSATGGSIGLFNSKYSVFTATYFKVTTSTATPTTPTVVPQPTISNFSPTSGGAGTVVTINGADFTGLTQAWVGNARGVSVRVISSTQVQLTIPADATTGAIGIFNSQNAAFTATSFTMR
jgi:aryl-phospho-beta-D-glucosidase BglC (GH1 family)